MNEIFVYDFFFKFIIEWKANYDVKFVFFLKPEAVDVRRGLIFNWIYYQYPH